MSLSVGILYSSRKLLEILSENSLSSQDILSQFKKIYVARTEYVIDICKVCGWIEVTDSGCFFVTSKGQEILQTPSSTDMLRIQLQHFIYSKKPVWSRVLHYGRSEALQYVPKDVTQCFEEAGLLGTVDSSTISWWENMGAFSRRGIEDKKKSIGNKGELLSIQFERDRIGVNPIWKSFESNFAGYDILSKVSEEDNTSLMIEVKATIGTNKITFFITENEWKVALLSKNYLFHVWSLSQEPTLYILKPCDLEKNIPQNQGKGLWESVRIEYTQEELEPYRMK